MAYAAQQKPPLQPKPNGDHATPPNSTAPPRVNRARQVHQQYQRAQVETASPTRLIVLLYDGAIRFCALAREAMEARNLEAQHVNLIKAQRILAELMSTLDRKVGGEIADNLFNLYVYMLNQLVNANLHDRVEDVDTVVKMLEDLRATWQEVERITTQAQEKDASSAANPAPFESPIPPALPAATGATSPQSAPSSRPVPARAAQAMRLAQNLAATPTPSNSRLGDRNA